MVKKTDVPKARRGPNKAPTHQSQVVTRGTQPVGRTMPVRIWPVVTNPEAGCVYCTRAPKDGLMVIKFINSICGIHKEVA